jgi:hypothetical protein
VVGRAASVLALVVALFAYDYLAPHLWHEGVWWDVAVIALILMPATFGMVLLALPLYRARNLVVIGLSLVALTLALTIAHAHVPANFTRLAAATVIAWAFLRVFETVGLVVIVACIIPWVDAYSVWRGPTKTITTNHPHVFTDLSYAFPVPGQHAAANLGVPDLLFFSFFLAAAAQFGLRVIPTWIGMVAGLGATIALVVAFNANGLPALPGIALGFLVPNVDLLWTSLRRQPGIGDGAHVPLDGTPDDG